MGRPRTAKSRHIVSASFFACCWVNALSGIKATYNKIQLRTRHYDSQSLSYAPAVVQHSGYSLPAEASIIAVADERRKVRRDGGAAKEANCIGNLLGNAFERAALGELPFWRAHKHQRSEPSILNAERIELGMAAQQHDWRSGSDRPIQDALYSARAHP